MPNLVADLKNNDSKQNAESLIIEQKLNSLFYEKPMIEEEAEFIHLVLSKNGYNTERAGLHASAIITSDNEFCYREQILSLFFKQKQGEQIPISQKRIFEAGTSIHEKWQRLFIRGKIATPQDLDHTRYANKYDLSYTPDAIVKIGKFQYIVEIKSVNTYQFKNMRSHPSGKKQLMLYMFLSGIHKGFVLAEDKNTQEFKVFVYDYDEEVVLPFIERLEAIQVYKKQFKEEKKIVKRICPNSTCKRALKCPMLDACFNIGMGRIKL
jgi:hypothetical protein